MAFALPALAAIQPYVQSAILGAGIDYIGKKAKKALKLKKGGKVLFNKKPRYMQVGGRVSEKRGMTMYQKRHDSVHALLQPGEIVIPKFYQKNKKRVNLVGMVAKYLKRKQINLPNM